MGKGTVGEGRKRMNKGNGRGEEERKGEWKGENGTEEGKTG